MQNSMVIFIFFGLRPETSLTSKFIPKNQNCQLKLKFGTSTNSTVKNTVVIFIFFLFWTKSILFWEICPKKSKSFVEVFA